MYLGNVKESEKRAFILNAFLYDENGELEERINHDLYRMLGLFTVLWNWPGPRKSVWEERIYGM